MTTIYFVRHAQPNYGNNDDFSRELTDKGLKDRDLVAAFLSDKPVDIMLSSPYKRAADTIKGFADEYGYEIALVSGFRERRVDSIWIDDFNSFSKKQWEDFSYKLSDGEALGEVQNRNIAALTDVLKKHEGKTVVIGSHGTALCTIINYYDNSFGYNDFDRIKKLMPWIVRFRFDKKKCVQIKEYNLFTGESVVIYKL